MVVEKNGYRSQGKKLKLYKIARYAGRRDAKRHHVASILAKDDDAAVQEFIDYINLKPDALVCRYELCTGDWKRVVFVYDGG